MQPNSSTLSSSNTASSNNNVNLIKNPSTLSAVSSSSPSSQSTTPKTEISNQKPELNRSNSTTIYTATKTGANPTSVASTSSSSSSTTANDNIKTVKITNLPSRSQNPNLKENLYDEFLKYGRISTIRIEGEGEKKVCYISFKHTDQALAAIENLNDKLFLQQTVLKVDKHETASNHLNNNASSNVNSNPGTASSNASSTTSSTAGSGQSTSVTSISLSSTTKTAANTAADEDLDEYSLRATRTLYIGNLDRDVKYSDLREKLDKKYGDIIEIEIKKDNKKQQSNSSNSYAFIQFSDIKSVIKAMRCMNGKCIGNNLIKLGFGKSKPTRVLWLDGISDQLKDTYLLDYFKTYCENNVHQALIDRIKCQALVYFGTIEDAKMCADKIRAKRFYDRRIMVDFASKEFISSRFEHLLDPKHHILINQRPTGVNSSTGNEKERKGSSRNLLGYLSSRQRSLSPSNRSLSQRSRTNSNNEVIIYNLL